MGVDLYVSRSAPQSALISEPVIEVAVESHQIPPIVSVESITEVVSKSETAPKAKVEEPLQAERLNSEQEAQPASQQLNDSEDTTEAATEVAIESAKADEPSIDPIYFIWQQAGSRLFLSASFEKQGTAETKLLEAIVRSLGDVGKADKGSGNWPLENSARSTQSEAEHFLTSFVDGRAELLGEKIQLVVLGELAQKLFPEVTGSFVEIRILPALKDMLSDTSLKPLAWRKIMDLRAPQP